MFRSLASNTLTVLILGFFLVGALGVWGKSQFVTDGPLQSAICFKVGSGSTLRTVAKNLVKDKAISSDFIFRVSMESSGLSRRIKAGSFLVPKNASMAEISKRITESGVSNCGTEIIYRVGITSLKIEVRDTDPNTGKMAKVAEFPFDEFANEKLNEFISQHSTRFRVALAEGVSSWKVYKALSDIKFLKGDMENIPDEGTIAPESYDFTNGASRKLLVERMQKRQESILEDAWTARQPNLPLTKKDEALILASIIEKETSVEIERSKVSSVFINRLLRDIALQTDASVLYGITKGKKALGRGLRRSELKKDTPWNTYVHKGLPPSPIGNPGKASIFAALNPDRTNYLYFVADGSGGHAFAENLRDHNINVAKWRKIENGDN
ncbi:MAG: endolytic transglycosylase MltG [Rhodobacteraceae bacterium]|nr:endolytic transglycosylase MltG [Paracoccaceae bacterium]